MMAFLFKSNVIDLMYLIFQFRYRSSYFIRRIEMAFFALRRGNDARLPVPAVASVGAAVALVVLGIGYLRCTPALGSRLPASHPAGGPARLLFRSPESGMEREFISSLAPATQGCVTVNDVQAAAARGLTIKETPTLVELDPNGRETGRWVGPERIKAELATLTPATCVRHHVPRLRWVEETDPVARKVYRHFERGEVPDIYKAMSLRPELMEKVRSLCDQSHFEDGYLPRRTKERIATLVSGLNHSTYCTGSHSDGLRQLGSSEQEIAALKQGDPDAAPLPKKDKALLQFARRLTLKPGEVSDEDISRLRSAGWKDEQIFEAAFDASLFSFFNRVAATYGLDEAPDDTTP